jgi:DNA-directed RNA polymerase subunit RPC12/RpoP
LDHSGNVSRHGFAEDIVPFELDDGDKKFTESNQVKKEKEAKVWECPECYQQRSGIACPCGYEIPMKERLKSDEQMLKRMKASERNMATTTEDDRRKFLGELYLHAENKGYKTGWADRLFKQKFGDWPNGMTPITAEKISDSVRNYIKHDTIRRVKSSWGRASL